MRTIRALTGPIVLGALLATTPQAAFGQGGDRAADDGIYSVALDARPGTEIRADQLGEYLAKNVRVNFHRWPDDILDSPSAALRVELFSRENGVVATYESQAGRVEPGRSYRGSMWITQPSALDERLAAPLRPAEFVIFRIGQKTIVGFGRHAIPQECEDATHAVRVTLVSDGERMWGDDEVQPLVACLNVKR